MVPSLDAKLTGIVWVDKRNLVRGIQGQPFTNHNSRFSPKWSQKALFQKVASILSLAPIFGVAVNVDIYLAPRLM